MRSRVITIAALALAAGTVAGTAQEFEPWEQELYEAAREEGEIIWYVSQTTSEFAETVCQAFEARYEGVDCNPIRATGSVTFQRVMQEVQAGSVQGDVYSSNDETDFVELNKVKALTAYVPNNIEHMSPSLREASNPDGYWFASNVSPYGIAYNTELVSEEEAPKNWTDLLDPKWKDQLAIAHPSFSGSMGMFAIAMRDKYGWEFFEKMEQNKPHIGRSIADGYNLVVSGERKVAVVPVSLSFAGEAEGKPVKTVFPTDGLMLPPSGTGILANAPHPNAARLFAEFMLGSDYAKLLAENRRYPLRDDVELTIPSLKDVELLVVDPETAGEALIEVQELFRDTFGI